MAPRMVACVILPGRLPLVRDRCPAARAKHAGVIHRLVAALGGHLVRRPTLRAGAMPPGPRAVTRRPDSSPCSPSALRHRPCTASVDGAMHRSHGFEAFTTVASLTRCCTKAAHISVVRSTGLGGCLVKDDAQGCTVGPDGPAGVTASGQGPWFALPHAGQPWSWARCALTALRIAGLSHPWRSA